MSIRWTTQHVAALAPDAASLKAGEKLGMAAKWQTLGRADVTIWGEIKGSGKKPYQTSIALEEPAFKCSCPSRKFPCKHGVALALVFASNPDDFQTVEPLPWVQEWLDKRGARAQKQINKAAEKDKPVDEATLKKREQAQKKRGAAREKKVEAGIEELRRWLFDLVRQGIAHSDQQPWDHIATRMVDSQAPGLARRLQAIATIRYQYNDWQARTLAAIAKLHLLLEAWQRVSRLPELVQSDVRSQIGFPVSKEEVLTGDSISDDWCVLGQSQEQDGQMQSQFTWVYGRATKQYALLLDFSGYGQAMTLYPAIGTGMPAELVYYPSAVPQRAVLKAEANRLNTELSPVSSAFISLDEALENYGKALAQCPWLERFPMALKSVTPVSQDGQWYLVDAEQKSLPMRIASAQVWPLLAAGGGYPQDIFGCWDGDRLQVLSAWDAGTLCWADGGIAMNGGSV